MFSKPTIYFGKDVIHFSHNGDEESFPFVDLDVKKTLTFLLERNNLHVNVILSPQHTYTVGMKLTDDQLTRIVIQELLKMQVPEVIDNHRFDWSVQASDTTHKYVQASVIRSDFFNSFSEQLESSQISPTYIKPVEVLLAEAVEDELTDAGSFILCLSEPEPLFIFLSEHTVWLSGLIIDDIPSFTDFAAFAKEEDITLPTSVLYDSGFVELSGAKSFLSSTPSDITTSEIELDLYAHAQHVNVNSSKDADVLSFVLSESSEKKKFSSKKTIFMILAVLVLFIISAVVTVAFSPFR